MARPREFEIEDVLNSAAEVFKTKGYHATSLDDLIAGTGLTKGSLYKAFKDKRAIFIAALNQYSRNFLSHFDASLRRAGSPKEAIRQTFLDFIENAVQFPNSRGCLLTNTAIELGSQDEEISAYLQEKYRLRCEVFARAIERAQLAGEIDPKKDKIVLAQYLEMSLHGLRVLIRLGIVKEKLVQSVDQALTVLV